LGLAARILRIQRGEGRQAALVVSLMLTSMAAHTMGESGVDALFFDRVGAQSLPLVYLLQGGTTFVVMLGLTGFLGRLGPRRAYLGAPLALGVLVVVVRAIVATDLRWIYFVGWITAGMGLIVLGVFLWGTAGAVVDTRQAKRLFPLFGAGGILGSVVGGLLTRPLALVIGAQNLLLVWAGGLGVAFVLARLVLGPAARTTRRRAVRKGPSALRDMSRALLYVRRSRLLVWMTAAGYLAFGDLPDGWTIFGAAIIVASGLYILHREHRLRLASRTAPNTEASDLAKKL
jgi:drug/metabolite transporter (DMT)-like permease